MCGGGGGGGGGVTLNFDITVRGGHVLKEESIPRWCFSCMFHDFDLWLYLVSQS